MTKKKKLWILVAALAVVLAAAVTAGAFLLPGLLGSDEGNSADPKVSWYSEKQDEFVITTADQLYDLAYLSSKYSFEGQKIVLGADIIVNTGNAEDWLTGAPERLWYPIDGFNGTFDGQGHSISGLYGVNFTDQMGLFSNTKEYAVVQNLKVTNSCFISHGKQGTGVISSNGGGTFDTIYTDAIIAATNWNNGGIIGKVDMNGDTLITNCWFDGKMILTSDNGRVAGGIVGDIVLENGVCTINHCLNSGAFSAEAQTNTSRGRLMDIGGIVGRASGGTTNISDCFSAIQIDSDCVEGVGVLIGSAGKSTTNISHSYAVPNGSVKGLGYRYNKTVGDVYNYSENYVYGYNAYKWTTLDFEEFWAVDEDGYPVLQSFAETIPSLEGIEREIDTSWYNKTKTYRIGNYKQLLGLHIVSQWDSLSGKIILLTDDIVVQEGDASTWGENAPEITWKGLSSANVMFQGTFDGGGHTVSGLYQKKAANGLGFFVAITDGSVIRNLRIENSYFETNNVAVNNQTYSYIGSITAYARGATIDGCYSNAYMASDGYFCGGLVGLLRNGKASTVSNCWFDGVVTLTGINTGMRGGGLVGCVWNTTINMTHCLNTGYMSSESWAWGANEGLMVGYPNSKSVVKIEDSVCAATLMVLDGKKDGNGMFVGRVSGDASVTFDSVFAIKTPDPAADPNSETQWYCNWGLTGYRDGTVECTGPALVLDKSYLTGSNAYRYTDLDFENFWAVDEDGNLRLQKFLDEDAKTLDVSGLSKAVDYSWYKPGSDLYIATREQLLALPLLATGDNFKEKTIHLSNSITVNYGNAADWQNYAPATKWTPIGGPDNMFQGTFDGHGYTISGIYVTGSGNCLGLFACTRNATVKNFRLTNSFVRSNGVAVSGAKGKVSSYNYIGGVAAYASNTDFSGIYTNAIVMNDGEMCGGIVGLINKVGEPVTISNCWFDGTIKQEWTSYKKADGGIYCVYYGGLVGLLRNAELTISHCAMTGTIEGVNFPDGTWGSVAGGFIGRIDNTGTNPAPKLTISDSLAYTKIAGYPASTVGNGTVVAQCNKNAVMHLKNVYAVPSIWKPVMQWQSKELGSGEVVTVGVSNLTGSKAYINADLNYTYYWSALEGKIPQLKRFASGTVAQKVTLDTSWYDASQTEYILTTADQLLGFASLSKTNTFEGKTIKLGNDIVFNEGDASTWGDAAPAKFWISIGSAASRFKGTFDGQGYTISGVYYQNEGADGTAMFECIDGGTVKNFKLVNSYFDDSRESTGAAAWSRVSSVVATAYSGTVSDIYTDAFVSGGTMYNGGIVGMFRAPGTTTTAALTIENCWFDGTLDLGATGRASGGIIGGGCEGNKEYTTLTIKNCLMSGDIKGTFCDTGCNANNTYEVTSIGGVIGNIINTKVNVDGVVVTGTMDVDTTSTYIGSLLGYKNYGCGTGTSKNIYILDGICHQQFVNLAHNTSGATWNAVNVKAENMLGGMARNFADGLDFTESGAWIAVEDKYPELRAFSDATDAPMVADPNAETTDWYDESLTEYVISTVGEMKGFVTLSQTNSFEGKTIKLGADIEWNDGDAADWSASAPYSTWKFIGSATTPFKGTFDGQGHTLSGVYYMSTVGSTYVGLFMEVENATIKNLILDNSALHTTSGSGGNGLLVGRANGVTIENVMVTDSVYGSKSTYSGIVAYAQSANAVTFKNVWMAGNLTTEMWTTKFGGLLGGVANVNGLVITVENCLFTGSIEQTHATSTASNTVGGFVGELASDVKLNVKNSLSAGTIITQPGATMYAGSVVGNSSWKGAAYTTYENVYATKDCYSVGTYRQPSEYTGTIELVLTAAIKGGLARWNLPGLDFTESGAWIAVENAIPELRYFSEAEDAPVVEDPATGPAVLYEITVTAPTKTIYDIGASLVTDGMVVKGIYSNGTEAEIAESDYTITGFDSSAVGTVTVTVTHEGMTATFNVKIADIPDDPNEETTYWYDPALDEYVISTIGEMKGFVTLSKTNTFNGKTVKLGADIVWNEGNAADWATTAPANVWTPIGDQDNGFLGTFDGQGHTVSGLYCVDIGYASFVARLYSPGCVKNVSVVNSYFRSNGNTKNYSGAGVVARLQNATVSGIYTNAIFEAVWDCGIVASVPAGTSSISNCWFDGTIVNATRAGGIVGFACKDTVHTITNCLFTGSISGDSTHEDANYGGIAGAAPYSAKLNLTNCLSAGNLSGVTSTGNVGAVVGNNPGGNASVQSGVYATIGTHANLKGAGGDAFNASFVANADVLGGVARTTLVGFDFTEGGEWIAVADQLPELRMFSDAEEAPEVAVLTGINVTAPTKLTYNIGETLVTDGMVVKAVFSDSTEEELTAADYAVTGFDSSAVGEVTVTVTYNGKTATFLVTIEDPTIETTEWYNDTDTEFTLTTLGEFKGFVTLAQTNDFEGKTIKLATDIAWNTLGEGEKASDWATTAPVNAWTPIPSFKGTLDGDNHTISGLYVNGEGPNGMFATVTGATIKNLTLTDSCIINPKVTAVTNGILVGEANGVTIENVKVAETVTLTGGSNLGLVGYGKTAAAITFKQVWMAGTVTTGNATARIGGLLGYVDNTSGLTIDIENCLFTGAISYTNATANGTKYAGGFLGQGRANVVLTITDSLSAGSIELGGNTKFNVGSVAGVISSTADRNTFTDVYATTECYSVVCDRTTTGITQVAEAHLKGDLAKTTASGLDFSEEGAWVAVEDATPILKIFAPVADSE